MQWNITPLIPYILDRYHQNLYMFWLRIFSSICIVVTASVCFSQARSIQELAKKNFESLRQGSDDNESEPKIVRRGRPPTKNKRQPGRPPLEHTASEFSSDATLATGGENASWSNHDLRKGLADSSVRGSQDVHPSWLADIKFERNEDFTGLKK